MFFEVSWPFYLPSSSCGVYCVEQCISGQANYGNIGAKPCAYLQSTLNSTNVLYFLLNQSLKCQLLVAGFP